MAMQWSTPPAALPSEAEAISLNFDSIGFGKRVGDHTYLHISALPEFPSQWRDFIGLTTSLARLTPGDDFNVVKIHKSCDEVSLLDSADFFLDPFPTLSRSWRIHISRKTTVFRSYKESRNPPILHRKELLLTPGDIRAAEYAALTQAAESIGLFQDPNCIGFREHWYALIAQRGYQLQGNQFIPLANAGSEPPDNEEPHSDVIRRHLTALSRSHFSAPVQALSRHGLVNAKTTFFDYGCGRGDDVRGLSTSGIDATGWDPHFESDGIKRVADTVNLGFVINVIEDLTERVDALKGAYECTRGVLSVAAMLASDARPEGRQYRDGYLSSRNTFQKYFTQAQLRDFIEHTLDESAIACGPGVFFVFRDKDLEQQFLTKRYGHRTQTVLSRGWIHDRPRREPRPRVDRALQLFEANRPALDRLWLRILELGRPPDRDEVDSQLLPAIEANLSTLSKALKLTLSQNDPAELERSRAARTSDLLVLFALQQFQRRKPYSHLERKLQTDVRYFFGNYSTAQETARQALFGISNLEAIDQACRESYEKGYGWLEEGHFLQLHATHLERLPTILRIYVECATVLCGDISEFDLIKIHIRSGKITLMKYDDFANSPLPRLKQRVKVKLRDQDLDIFTYGTEYPPTLLYRKSRYINEEFPNYFEQVTFEESLDSLGIHDLTGFGPPAVEFFASLERARWQIDGFTLVRSKRIPNLDEPCGANLTYRQLIECGETRAASGIANMPREADSYTALHDLASKVLDPIIDYFGMIKLTYGFCSFELRKKISGRISPGLDQHAAHEKNKSGTLICERLGSACDFLVEHEDMREVADWVLDNTPCDRIYLYDRDRPIHVSYSNEPLGQLVEMRPANNDKRIPRIIRNRSKAAGS